MSRRNRKKKNKEAAPQIKTIRGVTSTGFAFEITKERLENYELLEAISEVDTNPAVLPKVVQLMLGNKFLWINWGQKLVRSLQVRTS